MGVLVFEQPDRPGMRIDVTTHVVSRLPASHLDWSSDEDDSSSLRFTIVDLVALRGNIRQQSYNHMVGQVQLSLRILMKCTV